MATKDKKIIAEWVGTARLPAMKGTARALTQKEVEQSLVMDITRDLRWGSETSFRANVTDEPTEFIDWLKANDEFKVTETP